MTLDREIVSTRLALMRALLADLDDLGEMPPDRLVRERLTRNAVERILEHLVELAAAINTHVVTSARIRSGVLSPLESGSTREPAASSVPDAPPFVRRARRDHSHDLAGVPASRGRDGAG